MSKVIAENVHFIHKLLLANGTIATRMLKRENSGNSCHNTKFCSTLGDHGVVSDDGGDDAIDGDDGHVSDDGLVMVMLVMTNGHDPD